MAVRSSMAALIARVRKMINDPSGASQQFDDQTIQDTLDQSRVDRRYELLLIAPSIVNTASTNHQPETIFADYYSRFTFWESDIVLQANDPVTNASWVVVTPTTSDDMTGHWVFEDNVYVSGVTPGQYPPVFATGKTFDIFFAAADLSEMWAANLACAYDITINGQSLRRSQMMQAKLTLAQMYRRQAKPKLTKLVRSDINPNLNTRSVRLLDGGDATKGA